MQISGYRAMWLLVVFDLPVRTKLQRKRASRFRKDLIQDGFDMIQFSVYSRPCPSEENAAVHRNRVRLKLPPEGRVRILWFTDKQYARMECYQGEIPMPTERSPSQLDLF
jgi:CRISPR-associated protein Cas2